MKRVTRMRVGISLLALALLMPAPFALAQDAPQTNEQIIKKLRKAYEDQKQQLQVLQRRLEELEERMAQRPPPAGSDVRPAIYGQPYGVGRAPSQTVPAADRDVAQAPPQQPTGTEQTPGQRRQEIEPALQAISDRAGVLTPVGTLVVEPRFEYTNDNRRQVLVEGFSVIPAIVVGNIDVREVNRDTLTGSLTGRLGVTNRFEVDVTVPYLYRTQDTTSRPVGTGASSDTTSSVDGNDIGDIQFGMHYQINDGLADWPVFIGNVLVRAPTGTDVFEIETDTNGLERELPTGSGFWGVEPSVTFLYPSDPVVFWGTVGYLINIGQTKDLQGGGTTDVDPGDAVRSSIGMGVALNERTSMGIGYQHDYVFDTEQDGQTLDNTGLQVGSLLLSGTHRLSKSTSVSMQVNVGVTEDAPDIRLLLRVPIKLNIF